MPLKKQRCVFGVLTTATVLLCVAYFREIRYTLFLTKKNQERLQYDSTTSTRIKVLPPAKTMLLYNPKHWETAIWKSFTNTSFWENCPYSCQITTDRKLYNKSDAVVFVIDLLGGGNLPKKMPQQVWIFAQYESTDYLMKEIGSQFVTKGNLEKYNRRVNWTLSYRRDSDIPFTHGSYGAKRGKERKYVDNKYGVAWFVSHCRTTSKRENYVRLIRKTTDVDIYGSCGSLKAPNCPKTRGDAIRECWGLSPSKCYDILDKKYLFYLSFENALCRDYVTEKGLHHVTQHQVIPIMRGGANYSIFSPPKSYINTRDFSSIEHLSKYLESVEKDKSLQHNFLNWKEYYDSSYPIENWRNNMCNICQRLNNPMKYSRIYDDIYKWIVTPNNKPGCFVPTDL
ncbi:alpha-(1,3)-fucosyltransferase C-like [Ostrea edulis]|uniref:alpha-(1,3)-fucosyltransferase C-like n=1 Tax=Ostrea edulis TaxID=37623 RepID=UPI00209523AF|nr:alpha-(1,3)-fucosyltransferase C-like [Ostrea edulis]